MTAAIIAMVVVGIGVFAGTSFLAKAAVAGDTSCGYGTSQFTESTVMRWAQTNGVGLTGPNAATFSAFANDENSTLLGVNTATAMTSPTTSAGQHAAGASGGDPLQHDGIALTASTLTGAAGTREQARPYYPALYITAVNGPGTWTTPGNAIPPATGDWQQGGTPRDLNSSGQPFIDDVFGDWVVGSQTINPSAAPGQVGTLGTGLVQNTTYGTNTTPYSLAISSPGLTQAVVSGDTIVLSAVIAGQTKTQNLTATAAASAGSNSISVKTFKAGASFPSGTTTVSDTTAQTGNYSRQSTLPTSNTTSSNWNLAGGNAPVGTTFTSMGSEGYGTEFRWNASNLSSWVPNAAGTGGSYQPLATGQWYKVQVVEHDGDQNKGGDSGEFCTMIKIPGPPAIKTDPTGGTDITGPNVDSTTLKQWIGTKIKDTAFLPAKTGFGNVTGTVAFHLYFDAGNAPTTCAHTTDTPPGANVFNDSQPLDGNDPSVATSGTYDTAGHGFGTYYWQDVFTPGGSNASSYTTVTEACGAQADQMVDARVRLTPHSAFNIIGNNHVLSAFVETTTDGSSWSAVSGAHVTTTLSPNTTSATYVGDSFCDTAAQTSPAGTYCNVTITDDIAETVFVNAASTFTATGVSGGVNGNDSISKSTDNKADCEADDVSGVSNGPSCEAVKHWINPTTTLHVTDTLVGLTGNVGGSVTYTAYTGTDDATVLAACQGGTGGTDETVSGSNPFNGATAPVSGSVDVPDGTVVYYTATYTGNLGTFTSGCTEKASSG